MKTRLVAMAVLALAGCGRSDAPDKAAAAGNASRAPVVAAEEAVAAVLQSAGKPIARVGFLLGSKPLLGASSTLRLDIAADEPVPALLLAAEGEAIAIEPATAQASLALAEAGTVVSYQLTFTPQRAGLAQILVRLRNADAAGVETVYAIPLLVAAAPAG